MVGNINLSLTSLTRRDFNISAVPELFGVRVSVAAHAHAQVDPVCRAGSALAIPRCRVELVVSRVPARVARVCTPSGLKYKKHARAAERGRTVRNVGLTLIHKDRQMGYINTIGTNNTDHQTAVR